ncbi:MAG: alpha-D-ribose 1-methylphosphonate 5-triphosphate diphosphatase [Tabrizicola sp.]|jgi:alpha-D-ribose 1-methylphosphonate 5-triphosphate diphosphatase|nr:alpha-D-ribose 1-methylphosphonate 5-triphosphate diphosphatase [Tabrizicola sp.]
MSQIAPLRLTRARCLIEGTLHDHPLTIAEGHIADCPGREVDLSGYLVLPGIIDLHGDGFERHLTPRPSAPFDKLRALGSLAGELAANGITTAWLAQSWSWEGGHRSGVATMALLAALDAAKAQLLPDVRVQIRLETHVVDEHPAVLRAVAAHKVDFVIFNNHLPEALELAAGRPDRFASWAAQHRLTSEEMLAIVRTAEAQEHLVPAALTAIAAELARLGVKMGSHDDATAKARAFYRSIGAPVSEFPTSMEAAHAAHAAREPVLMGAPNVVRGGSQSGNIAATDLVKEGLVDALMSDYYYPALQQAAWALHDQGITDLPAAWAMVSEAPARIMGLADRGRLENGLRADLAVVNVETRQIEMTLAQGRVAHLSGELARRIAA